jgi:hypothetical protein
MNTRMETGRRLHADHSCRRTARASTATWPRSALYVARGSGAMTRAGAADVEITDTYVAGSRRPRSSATSG